jgi:hypothetical protein
MKVERDIKPVHAWVYPECQNDGVIKVWRPGRPDTAHMVRCEQCSGLLQFRAPR